MAPTVAPAPLAPADRVRFVRTNLQPFAATIAGNYVRPGDCGVVEMDSPLMPGHLACRFDGISELVTVPRSNLQRVQDVDSASWNPLAD